MVGGWIWGWARFKLHGGCGEIAAADVCMSIENHFRFRVRLGGPPCLTPSTSKFTDQHTLSNHQHQSAVDPPQMLRQPHRE